MTSEKEPYTQGASTARKAIAEGVPRWMVISDRAFGQMIDQTTGLPIAQLSAPPALADRQASFAQGFNEVISAAIASGEVTVDFRPLLMTRVEVVRALAECKLGTLSTENPRIQPADGQFVLELKFPAKKAKKKLIWIRYSLPTGEEWPKFDLYDGPLDVAIGREGRVLVFKTASVFLTRDIITTQVLNSYLL